MLDALTGLSDEINTAITDKLPLVTQFNTTLHTFIDDLSITAASTLTEFRDRVDAFGTLVDSLSATLRSVSADITAAASKQSTFDLTTIVTQVTSVQTTLNSLDFATITVSGRGLPPKVCVRLNWMCFYRRACPNCARLMRRFKR